MNNVYLMILTSAFFLLAGCSSEQQSRSSDAGSISIGASSTVSINGLPAAKQLATNLNCGSIQDQISSNNVMINGKPAARQTEELLNLCQSIENSDVAINVNIGD